MAVSITATEANQSFSRLLREVQDGKEFIITSRGRAIARVVPHVGDDSGQRLTDLLGKLEALPRRTLPGWTREDLYS